MERFVPEGANVTFATVQINGGENNQSNPGIEVCVSLSLLLMKK
jgi:hypothetical protein